MRNRLAGLAGAVTIAGALLSAVPFAGQREESNRERLDRASRAFWHSPSLARFEAVGFAMADAIAPTNREMQEGRSYRPANAEFDAMKKRLKSDLLVARDGFPEPPVTVREADATVNPERVSAARPSFFAKDELLFAIPLRPFTLRDAFETGAELADAASILQKVAFRVQVGGTPGFGTDGPLGLWDVDSAEVTFSRSVHLNGVTAGGVSTAYDLDSFVTPLGVRQCGQGPALSIRGRASPGWSSAIVAWIGKSAPARRATVTRATVGGPGQYQKRVVETVDLDGDAVADFSLWGGLDREVASTDTFWKAVYVNLGGAWRLMAYRQEEDCT